MPVFLNISQTEPGIALICAQIDPHWSVKLSIYGFMLLAVWILYCAWREGRENFTTYIMGFLFGYSIEAVNTLAGNYCYQFGPEWLYLPGQVPLYVSCGWAMIFYAAYYTSLQLRRNWLFVATTSGLLALALDLILDPGTVALGLWEWLPPSELASVWPWYSVPWSNFVGWYLLIFSLALAQYLLVNQFDTDQTAPQRWSTLLLRKIKVMALAYVCFAVLYFVYSTAVSLVAGHVYQTLLHASLVAIPCAYLLMRAGTLQTGSALQLSLLLVPGYLIFCASLYLLWVMANQVYQPLIFLLPSYSIVVLSIYYWPYRQ